MDTNSTLIELLHNRFPSFSVVSPVPVDDHAFNRRAGQAKRPRLANQIGSGNSSQDRRLIRGDRQCPGSCRAGCKREGGFRCKCALRSNVNWFREGLQDLCRSRLVGDNHDCRGALGRSSAYSCYRCDWQRRTLGKHQAHASETEAD